MNINEAIADKTTISATTREKLQDQITGFAEDAVKNYGGTTEHKDIERLAQKTADLLYSKYGGLTPTEVQYVFDTGTRGEYGTDFALSMKNITKWMQLYLMSDERIAAKKAYDAAHISQVIDYDGEIKKKNEASLWELLQRYYDQISKGEPYEGLPNNQARVYNFLRSKGLTMVSSRAEEKQIMLAALEEAKRPRRADIWTAWLTFDETTRAKAICLERLIRNNLGAVHNILMHRY